MYISKVELEKFKCFNHASIEMGKITLLTGANSSGKSSLLQSILSMLQSEAFPFYLSPNGRFVDLGSFEEMSFQNARNGVIKMAFEVKGTGPTIRKKPITVKTSWVENKRSRLPQLDSLEYDSFRLWIKIERRGRRCFLSVKDQIENKYILNKLIPTLEKKIPELLNASVLNIKRNTKEIIDAPFYSIASLLQKTFYNEDISLFDDYRRILSDFPSIITESTNFIGAFRGRPERTYYQKTKAQERVVQSGDGYIDQIVEWEERKDESFKELTKIMRSLGMLYQIRTKNFKGGRFELQIRVHRGGRLASLTDVGFGISQFLPVIVSDIQLGPSSLLVMSQPEIHLHPKVQAQLADYMIEQSKKREKRYLVETHSEYLINRLRLSIVKGNIAPEDVAVYYFTNTSKGTEVHKIQLNKLGSIENAPKDFFDTYMMDVMDIAVNA